MISCRLLVYLHHINLDFGSIFWSRMSIIKGTRCSFLHVFLLRPLCAKMDGRGRKSQLPAVTLGLPTDCQTSGSARENKEKRPETEFKIIQIILHCYYVLT